MAASIEYRGIISPSAEGLLYKSLIHEHLWMRLVGRIARENPLLSDVEAERVLDSTVGFLKLCADHPGVRFTPSKKVDIGWHAFLMYTRDYAKFCERVAGRFIHHEPNDSGTRLGMTVAATVAFMGKREIPYHRELWPTVVMGDSDRDGGTHADCDSGPPDCGEGDCNSDGDA